MPMHSAAHFNCILSHFVEEEVPLERPKYHKQLPSLQSRMREPRNCAQPGLRSDKGASRLHRTQIPLRHLPVRLLNIPAKLPFHIA